MNGVRVDSPQFVPARPAIPGFEPPAEGPPKHCARPQQGYALLFVLLVAAGIAIALYAELPRVAFESQRNREELLIWRGSQYQRAIGLYLKKFQRLPAKIEDLENTNNMRFLRRRYVDPMTGKNEWRIVHSTNGVLTDSLVKPANPLGSKDGKDPMAPGGSMNVNPGFSTGSTTDPAQAQEVNPAVLRRASDRPLTNAAAVQNMVPQWAQTADPNAPAPPPPPDMYPANYPPPAGTANAVPVDPNAPNTQPGAGNSNQAGQQTQPAQPGQLTMQPGQQPLPTGQNVPPGALPPGVLPPGAVPGTGQMQNQAQPPQQQQQQQQQQQFPVQQFPQPTTFTQPTPTTASTSAFNNPGGAQAVQQMLQGAQQVPTQGTGIMGTGIAGVASTYKGPAIKVYNEQERYEKWEFVYDPKKDPALTKNLPQQQKVDNPGNTTGTGQGKRPGA